ncbi:MAG: neutral zinc metallopeptidase [Acidimicrobiia bacterium]
MRPQHTSMRGRAYRLVIAAAVLAVVAAACESSTGSSPPPAPDPGPSRPFQLGDDPFLDSLWDACEAGGWASCDELALAGGEGTVYGEFGASCGLRNEPGGSCATRHGNELAPPPGEPPAPPPAPEPGFGYEDAYRLFTTGLEEFWSRRMDDITPAVVVPFTPLAGGYVSYVPGETTCGGNLASAGTAFYCRADDAIAVDHQAYGRRFEQYGPLSLAWVLAHEWGHAIQHRHAITLGSGNDRDYEAHADCLSGAYIGYLIAGNDAAFRPTAADVEGLRRMLFDEFGDDLPWEAENSHGPGGFRLDHYQAGVDTGPEGCGTYYEPEGPFIEVQSVGWQSATVDNVAGISFLVTFTATGFHDLPLGVNVFVYQENGSPAASRSATYATQSGQLTVQRTVTPGFFDTRYDDLELFVPAGAFDTAGTFYAVVQIVDEDVQLWAEGRSSPFTLSTG